MLLDYEYARDLLELNLEYEETDRFIFNSAYIQMCNILGYDLELCSYSEVLAVDNCKVFLSCFPVVSVDNITDCNINASVDCFSVDYHGRSIFFQPAINGHFVSVNYHAGYTEETFPADLKEAVIKLFVIRRNDFYDVTNNGNGKDLKKDYLPSDIRRIFNFYSKKRF